MLEVKLEIEERLEDGVIKTNKACKIPAGIRCFERNSLCISIGCYGAPYNEKTQCYECPIGDFKKPALNYAKEC